MGKRIPEEGGEERKEARLDEPVDSPPLWILFTVDHVVALSHYITMNDLYFPRTHGCVLPRALTLCFSLKCFMRSNLLFPF